MGLMKIDQTGLPAGTPGESRSDGLDTGAQVTLTSTTPGTTHEFRFLWHPTADTDAVSSLVQTGSPEVWTFSPTAGVYGSYLIELIVDEGLATESRERRIFGIRTPNRGLLIPAWNEGADPNGSLVNLGPLVVKASTMNENGNATGWWLAFEEALLDLDDAGAGGGGTDIEVLDEGGSLTSALESIDFVGTGVEATNVGGAVTVTVNLPAGSPIEALDEDVSLNADITSLNFKGEGVTATNIGQDITVTVPGVEVTQRNLHDLTHDPEGLWQFSPNPDLVADLPWRSDVSPNDHGGFGNVAGALRVTKGPAPNTSALFLDGGTRLVNSAGGTEIDPPSVGVAISVEALIFLNTFVGTGEFAHIFEFGSSGETLNDNVLYGLQLWQNNRLIAYWETGNGTQNQLVPADLYALPIGEWIHVAFTMSAGGVGNTTVRLYVNGEMIAEDTSANHSDGGVNGKLYIGGSVESGADFFSGCLSSLKVIYGTELTPQQVADEARFTLPEQIGLADGFAPRLHDTTHNPVGLWQLDGNLLDSSGNGLTLDSVSGSEQYGSAVSSKNSAAYFDGSTIISRSIHDSILALDEDVTLELLCFPVEFQSGGSNPVVANFGAVGETAADNILYQIYFQAAAPGNRLRGFWEAGAGGNVAVSPDMPRILAPGRWHHIAFTRENGLGKIYHNGKKLKETAGTEPIGEGTNSVMTLGGSGETGYGNFKGFLSSVKVIPFALNQEQILKEVERTLPEVVSRTPVLQFGDDHSIQTDIRLRQTSLTSPQTAQTMNFNVSEDGWYRIGWLIQRRMDTTTGQLEYSIDVDDTTNIFKAPGGEDRALIEVSDVDNRLFDSGFSTVFLTAGAHVLKIKWQVTSGATATIYESRLEVFRTTAVEQVIS